MIRLVTLLATVSLIATPAHAKDEAERLIDKLTEVSKPGFGYSGYFSGSDFLPYEDTEQLGTLVLGAGHHDRSETLRKIVEMGADAVPVLMKHIGDKRKTKLGPMSGMMWMDFPDEYDFNRRTCKKAPQGVNRDTWDDGEEYPDNHTITVGDLCFVALGQIVNRNFTATRYQPTAGLVVNSPSYSKRLRDAVTAEWKGLTPEEHRRLLIQDFTTPDHEERQIGAYLRLSFYYPDAVEALVVKELQKPALNLVKIASLCYEELYTTADKDRRKQIFEKFVRDNGDLYSKAVECQLFDDLAFLESNEEEDSSPLPEEFVTQPRELLVQLFGKPANVKSTDRPAVEFACKLERNRLIGSLTRDKSKRIGEIVRKTFVANSQDTYHASVCLRCLANRGYGDLLIEQLEKIDVAETKTNKLHLSYLHAISTSKEAAVQDKLLEIIETTKNDRYFMAAFPGVDDSHAATIFESAKRILAGLPADTDRGRDILQMIGRRFPDKCKPVYKDFLSNGSAKRADTMCWVLWYGSPLSKELLGPMLDDKRKLGGFSIPMRVCDRAAAAISHTTDKIEFDSEWPMHRKAAAIERLKKYCKQK